MISEHVPVPVWQNGKLTEDRWGLAVDIGRDVWGLAWDGQLTHMCYSFEGAPPAEAVERVREGGWWSFDVGRDLRVSVGDLERAFRELGALPSAPRLPWRSLPPVRGWHAGRARHDTDAEDACPCPQEPCGLVNLARTAPGCRQHRPAWARTIRQWHPANRCPGRRT